MLKAISTITNALGALNYKGTWNASTNTPTLTSSVGAKGDYYVVSVAGTTNLNGEALWGVGDWAVFNGSVWQRVEGGDTVNATSITTPTVQATSSGGLALKNSGGTTQLSLGAGGGDNITLSVATNITPANAAVAISPTGTGTVTINPATASTINNTSIGATTALTGRFTSVTATTGNFEVGTSGQGVDFSATPGTGTSELLADYEEGTWTPIFTSVGGTPTITYTVQQGSYVKVGKLVYASFYLGTSAISGGSSRLLIAGLPFTNQNVDESDRSCLVFGLITGFDSTTTPTAGILASNSTLIHLYTNNSADARDNKSTDVSCPPASAPGIYGTIMYRAAA